MPDVLATRDYLSPREVEAIFGIPVSTLSYWRRTTGHGPKFCHVGERRIKYRRTDVEAWIQEKNNDA